MLKYDTFILEHKFWGKSITEFLNWIKSKSNKYWVVLDTETTGLPTDPYEIQLTQVACIVFKYNFETNSFKEIDKFNQKIKLTKNTLDLMKNKSRIKNVLSFNHYGENDTKFFQEENVLVDLFEFLKPYDNPILVIQNAIFDMRYLNTRNPNIKFNNEILDTKQIIQLFYLPTLQTLSEVDNSYKKIIDSIGTSTRDNGLISSSLSKIGPALGINMSGYHDALIDCRLATEMFKSIIDFLKDNKDLDITKYQSERIKVIK
jgi:DNA polymerase III epsilon subunit-like protein